MCCLFTGCGGTGETACIHSGGYLQATPHCVRGAAGEKARGVSRETMAVFMEPMWDEPMTVPAGVEPDMVRLRVHPSWYNAQRFDPCALPPFRPLEARARSTCPRACRLWPPAGTKRRTLAPSPPPPSRPTTDHRNLHASLVKLSSRYTGTHKEHRPPATGHQLRPTRAHVVVVVHVQKRPSVAASPPLWERWAQRSTWE